MEQLDIFNLGVEYHYRPPLLFNRPVRLFEAFAGVGCQAMAFKRAGLPYVSVGISEIDKHAIKSYKAIHGETTNYGDIKLMGEIPPCDVFTWSFPCTDLSKAGKRAGMNEDTRSGLVYEVLRLLKNTKQKPKCLIMENVPDLVQEAFKAQFYEIQKEIASHGYKNFTLVLNAKDFGVAQNRDRVFMVSLLGDYHYEFPMPIELEKRLKDYLEPNVPEKYYLSEKMIQFFNDNFRFNPKGEEDVVNTLCARDYKYPRCIQVGVLEGGKWDKMHDIARRYYDTDGIAPTIHTVGGGNLEPKILEPIGVAQRGRNGAQKIEYNSESIANTITTVQKDNMVVSGLYTKASKDFQSPPLKGLSRTLKATTPDAGIMTEEYVRKLTPKECWRLMGISDSDFDKAQAVCSNSQLYKQAGNGIVVDVFAAILKNLISQ